MTDGRGFCDDEAGPRCGVGALRIVFSHQSIRQRMRRPIARERRHHNACGELQLASLAGFK